MKQKEIWKDVVDYEGWYKISNLGRVWHVKKKYYVSISSPEGVYKVLRLSTNKHSKIKRLHRLLAKAFIPNPKNKECINHKDGNKLNNRIENLEWVSRGENIKHAHKNGLIKNKGEDSHLSKLTENDVLQIRSIYEQGWANCTEIAKVYNMNRTVIWKAIKGHTWKHI